MRSGRTPPASLWEADRTQILGSACALLHLINFDEPFGLSVVEAMACGTPVVAYSKGSMPEIVDVGVTGYLTKSVEESVDVLDDALRLDRHQVRTRAVARFSADRMVDDYIKVYERLLADPYPVAPPRRTTALV